MKTTRDKDSFTSEHDIAALESFYISTGNDVTSSHQLLPDGRKSYKRVQFGSNSGRDFSIKFHPIPKLFTVLELVIQGLRLLLCNL